MATVTFDKATRLYPGATKPAVDQLNERITQRKQQATQVATEVYWHAPNLSKQRVVGTRDTTVLPTDNDFYRDRYQIVQNNFPDVIRLGEGRDVADVPHPLSPARPSTSPGAISAAG